MEPVDQETKKTPTLKERFFDRVASWHTQLVQGQNKLDSQIDKIESSLPNKPTIKETLKAALQEGKVLLSDPVGFYGRFTGILASEIVLSFRPKGQDLQKPNG